MPANYTAVHTLPTYVVPDAFIAYAGPGPAVYVPLSRVDSNAAPFLHETAHAILWPERPAARFIADTAERRRAREAFPTWMNEGLPEYIAKTIGPPLHLPDHDTMLSGGLGGVDRSCASYVSAPDTVRFFRWIGSTQAPPQLMQDRVGVARPFYVCSFSFTKFLVARFGIRPVVALFYSDHVVADLEGMSGLRDDTLRARWLAEIMKR